MTAEKIAQKIKNADEKAIKKLLLRAQEIERRGLSNEDIILQLVADEYENGYKTPKFFNAGMYDKMNYMCRCYMDRTARIALYYDFVPDVDILRNVLVCLLEKAPIFHCEFWDNHFAPCWLVRDYHIDDLFTVEESDDLKQSVYDHSIQSYDDKCNVQMKITLFIKDGKCALAFRWNHMIFDGGGFKQLIKDITTNYNRFIAGETDKITFRTGSRKYSRVYDEMEHGNQARMKFKKTFAKDKKAIRYTEDRADDKVFITEKTMSGDVLRNMIKVGKECGGTVNDVFCAAYLRASYRLIGCDKNESMTVSSALDLRRYIKNPDRIGYTNHTNFMPCTVSKMGDSIRDTITELSKNTKALKADEFNGLYGLPMLNFAYCSMIYLQAEPAVKSFYYNANLQLTNIGYLGGESYTFDGHDLADAYISASAKYKPTTAICFFTVADKIVFTQPLRGNEEDRKISQKLLDLIEDELLSL